MNHMITSGPRGLIDRNAENLTTEEWEESVEWHRLIQRRSDGWSAESVFWCSHDESRKTKAFLLWAHRAAVRYLFNEGRSE